MNHPRNMIEEGWNYPEEYNGIVTDWINPAVEAIEAHTSGSTGSPKTIFLPKQLMHQSASRTIRYFGIDNNWLLGSCISAKYIGGKMMVVRAFEAKCQLICEKPSNRPVLNDFLRSERPALISVVPSQMWHILTLPLTESDKLRIRFLIGGSALPPTLRDSIVENGVNAWESYGMTETCSHIALRKVMKEEIPFTPLTGIEIDKSPDDTLIIKNGAQEEIITNDLADIDSNGNFRILGRLDNVIISGGLKVIPEQTESKIKLLLASSHWSSQISDLMIIPRPDNKWGEVPVLLLETTLPEEYNISSQAKQEIMTFLHKHKNLSLLPQEIPQDILFIQCLPRTSNGKLRRNSAKQELLNRI